MRKLSLFQHPQRDNSSAAFETKIGSYPWASRCMTDVKEGFKTLPLSDAHARLARQQGWYVWLARAQVLGKLDNAEFVDKAHHSLSNLVFNLNDISGTTFENPIQTMLTGTLMPWDALSTCCRGYMIDEEQFETMLWLEEYKPLASLTGTGESSRQLTQSANAPPLALLRKFFMQKHAIPLINYLESTVVISPAQSKHKASAAHLDYDKIEDDLRQCYPYPYLDPGSWNLNHYKVPLSVLEETPKVEDIVLWESILCPVISTYRYLEALIHVIQSVPLYKYSGLVYNAENDTWAVPPNYARQKKLAPVSLQQLQYQYFIPVPTCIHNLKNVDDIDLCDLWVNGFSWFATLLWRLYHLHRLKSIAEKPDDRCLIHATQLVIDSHIPLYAYNTKHGAFHDAFHLQKVEWECVEPRTQKSNHPLSPAALNEYGGLFARPHVHEAVKKTNYPRVFALYPAMTRWLVTVEETPSLIPSLNMSGYFFRYSHEHTAIQNWDDPKTAFITLMVSKMSMFRSRLRSDKTTAKHCFARHPIMSNILLTYKHVYELGNTHGENKRPPFQDRIRLWLTYKDPDTGPRDTQWVLDHCYTDFRYSTRFAMHEMMCYYINLIPAFKQCMLSHPHQGVMYKEWMTTVRNAAVFHRNRLGTIPLLQGDAKTTVIMYNDALLSRLYNATNKHLNFCCHYGTFSEVLETFLVKEYSSILTRVEVTLRAFSKEHAPDNELKQQIDSKYAQLQQLADNSRFVNFNKEQGTGDGEDDDANEEESVEEHAVFEHFHGDMLYNKEGDVDLDMLADMLLTANEAPQDGTATAETESAGNQKKDENNNDYYCYSKPEMRAIHRIFLDNILHIPLLDDPGNESISEMFNAMVWTTQRYHGARQTLPLKLLLLFGMSQQVLIRLYMIFIYYEQALPYNRITVMLKRLWQDYPQDCALLWRYLQLLKMFSTEQAILLPSHVAKNQRDARSHMVHLQSDSPNPAAITRMYYCASCKTWAHQLAQETTVYYAWNAQQKKFVMQTAQYSRANTLVNSASKPVKPVPKSNKFTGAMFNAQNRKNASSDHRLFKVSFKTDNWKASKRDFINDLRICDNECRKRVTTTMTGKVAQLMLPPDLRRALHFERTDVEFDEYRTWLQYGRLVSMYPLRPAQTKALNRKFKMYGADMDAENATPAVKEAIQAVQQKPKRGKRDVNGNVKKPEKENGKKRVRQSGDSGDDDSEPEKETGPNEQKENRDGDVESEDEHEVNTPNDGVIPPQVRETLSRYWMNDPAITEITTAGMHHGTVFKETRPVISAAAMRVDAIDATSKCGYPLLAFNGEGRVYILPTQYTCVAKACCLCAKCGKVMIAFDWNYAPGVGYVCEDHPNEFPINFKYNGGFWPARQASSNPNSVTGGVSSELVIQKQYFITASVQLQCLPTPWLNKYGFKNYMEATRLTQVPLESSIPHLARDETFFCFTCDLDHNAKPAKKYWANTMPITYINQKKHKTTRHNFCQNHFELFRSKLYKKQQQQQQAKPGMQARGFKQGTL